MNDPWLYKQESKEVISTYSPDFIRKSLEPVLVGQSEINTLIAYQEQIDALMIDTMRCEQSKRAHLFAESQRIMKFLKRYRTYELTDFAEIDGLKSREKWTSKDVGVLMENLKLPSKELSQLLKRTVKSIDKKKWELANNLKKYDFPTP